MRFWIDSIILSYAQVFFSAKKWLGGLLALATFIDVEIGVAGLLGVILSNVGAYLAGFNKTQIRSGLYGLNGLLVGLAIVFYYGINHSFLILLFIGCVLCLLVTATLNGFFTYHLNLPILSLPFVIVTVILYLASASYTGLNLNPKLINVSGFFFSMGLPQAVEIYLKSLGAIFFQINMLSGLMIFIGLLLYSRIATFLSILGFACGLGFYQMVGGNQGDITYGMIGFNFILTAIACGGALVIPSIPSYIIALLASMVSALLSGAIKPILSTYNIPVLAIPFNLTVLLFVYSLKFRYSAKPKLIDFIPGSPEENLYYALTRTKRLSGSKMSLPFYGTWAVSQAIEGRFTHKDKWAYAWDFVVLDDDGKTYRGSGNELTDFFAYGLPVASPDAGRVVRVKDEVTDNPIGKVNLEQNWGNSIIICHSPGFYSQVSHLSYKSIKVKEGEIVNRGDILGLCGNSGRSPEPHIHLQFQAYPDIGSPTIPWSFGNCVKVLPDKELFLTSISPQEGERLKNIEITEDIKRCLEFPLGKEYCFRVKFKNKTFEEKWVVEVDIYGNSYIASSIKNSKCFFVNDGWSLTLLDFIGSKDTALYGFFLSASKIPFYYNPNLVWKDTLPLTAFMTGPKRWLIDIVSPFFEWVKVCSNLRYAEGYRVNSEIKQTAGRDGKPFYQAEVFLNEGLGLSKIILKAKGAVKLEAEAV